MNRVRRCHGMMKCLHTIAKALGRITSIVIAVSAVVSVPVTLFAQAWSSGPNGSIYYNGGNIGIGTSMPNNSLQIITPPSNASPVIVNEANGVGGMSLNAVSGYSGLALGARWDGNNWIAMNPTAAFFYKTPNLFAVYGNSGLSPNTTYSPTMRMGMDLSTGNLGIGSSSPTERLTVVDAGNVNPFSGTLGVYAANLTQGVVVGYSGISKTTNNGQNSLSVDATATGNLLLQTQATGNVGIGTTNPQNKLSVNGTIQAKEVVVNANWSDSVFDSAYQLQPLDDLAKYIRQNHHLPEIPSQSEVEGKGVRVGDIESKLLAKIEELTLRIIELNEHEQQLTRRLSIVEDRTR